jgi:hypothetical protein
MLKKAMIAGVLLVWVTARAHATATPPEPPVPPWPAIAPLAGLPGLPGEDVLMFISSELGGRGVVKGAPYSATAVSETRQMLADGNRIVRSSSTRLFRDSQGRTRQEQGKGVVFINDVVAGKRVVLNTETRSARELPPRPPLPPVPPVPPVPPGQGSAPQPPPPPPSMSGDEARTWADAMRQWAREFSIRMRSDTAVVERDVDVVVRRSGDAAAGTPRVKERVEVIRLGDGDHPGPPPGLPMLAPPGPGTTTPLGSRDFDGVRADGTRTTWTIPAGRIGNEKPIEIVSERWYSPELMLVVYSRHADPRTGERLYRLEGIRRVEPAEDLFRIPSDYVLRAPGSPSKPDKK